LRGRSKKAIYAALFGNLGVALSKLLAAIFTGSVAMWAETLHSFSDTFNQVLLLIGIRTSTKAATDRHPFGHGKEQFFWSFIVATMIFGISGILSSEQGIVAILNIKQHHIGDVGLNYIILIISAAFEGNALRIAFSSFKETIEMRGEKVTFHALINEFQESKDPSLLTIMAEDSAALLGISIAGIGIFLSQMTGNMIYDAISSVAIGAILMFFAFFLARENKALLIGEAISKKDSKKIIDSILQIPEVNRIISLRSMHFSPEDVLIAMDVSLVDGLNTDKIEFVIDNIEQKVKSVIPYINPSKIYVEAEQDSCKINFRSRSKKIID
jgi:cation diffusion facilitator family transporter